MLVLGAFDAHGNAVVRIRVAGNAGSREYDAIVDTGFSGFVALPMIEMVNLGLTVDGAVSVMLGNGTIIDNLVSQASVAIGQRTERGSVLLDETSVDVLVGMAFLREFRLAWVLTHEAVVLYDK